MPSKIDLDYFKQLYQLYNNYPLAPDKIEMKGKRLSSYQLKTKELKEQKQKK